MCGLVARIYKDFTKQVPREAESSMELALSKLEHRGPDGNGLKLVGAAILGHVRLSILDLSDLGAQPMSSECSRYHMVYNGEIFNYRELRQELIDEDVVFLSDGDTEVLLKAYIKWGANCLTKLNGMFAFVIYDAELGTYFAARDQLGIKPLYYTRLEDSIVFASEMKALVDFLPERTINDRYLSSYLYDSALDYGAETLLRGIEQIQSGAFLTSSHHEQAIWYDLKGKVCEQVSVDLEVQCYRSLLEDAVEIRLRSDVPVTYTLSGGMDSSSLYAIGAQSIEPAYLRAFTLVDKKPGSPLALDMAGAKSVVDYVGGELRPVSFTDEPSIKMIKESIYYQDFPSWSLAHTAYDEVYKSIRADGYKVLIEGHGNDEILGGYPTHILDCAQSLMWQGRSRQCWLACVAYVNTKNSAYTKSRLQPWMVFMLLLFPGARAFTRKFKLFRSPYKKLFPKTRHELKKHLKDDGLTYMQTKLVDLVTRTIVPTVLRTFDRSTMRASIEMRPPFMDPRVVEASLALGDAARISGDAQKGILRQAMMGDLPDSITFNSIKSGFTDDIRLTADLFTPETIRERFSYEMKAIGLNAKSYSKFYAEYSIARDWERGIAINKIGALLCWAQIFKVQG